jgi:hypothetical protein
MKPALTASRAGAQEVALRTIKSLGRRLTLTSSTSTSSLNRSHAPVGMLDVERITRTAEPIATIVSRPTSSSSFLKG